MLQSHRDRSSGSFVLSSFSPVAAALAVACVTLALPATARAEFLNAGVEGGIAKRSADSPTNLKVGAAYGAHAELSLLPMLLVGPYVLHYELGSESVTDAKGAFTAIGARARFVLPMPGSDFHPYAYVGAGYTLASFSVPNFTDTSGHFVEIPIGVGLAYDIIPILQASLDVAYRLGTGFGGDAFPDTVPSGNLPSSGWSLLLGVAVDL